MTIVTTQTKSFVPNVDRGELCLPTSIAANCASRQVLAFPTSIAANCALFWFALFGCGGGSALGSSCLSLVGGEAVMIAVVLSVPLAQILAKVHDGLGETGLGETGLGEKAKGIGAKEFFPGFSWQEGAFLAGSCKVLSVAIVLIVYYSSSSGTVLGGENSAQTSATGSSPTAHKQYNTGGKDENLIEQDDVFSDEGTLFSDEDEGRGRDVEHGPLLGGTSSPRPVPAMERPRKLSWMHADFGLSSSSTGEEGTGSKSSASNSRSPGGRRAPPGPARARRSSFGRSFTVPTTTLSWRGGGRLGRKRADKNFCPVVSKQSSYTSFAHQLYKLIGHLQTHAYNVYKVYSHYVRNTCHQHCPPNCSV